MYSCVLGSVRLTMGGKLHNTVERPWDCWRKEFIPMCESDLMKIMNGTTGSALRNLGCSRGSLQYSALPQLWPNRDTMSVVQLSCMILFTPGTKHRYLSYSTRKINPLLGLVAVADKGSRMFKTQPLPLD
jgi:hypothetical protein